MKGLCASGACVAIALTGQTYAAGTIERDAIDRDAFFKKCEQSATDKLSFRALDREVMERFSLRSSVFNGDGRKNINLIFDEIEKTAPKPLDLKKAAYVLGTAYRESHGTMSASIKEKVWCLNRPGFRRHLFALN